MAIILERLARRRMSETCMLENAGDRASAAALGQSLYNEAAGGTFSGGAENDNHVGRIFVLSRERRPEWHARVRRGHGREE